MSVATNLKPTVGLAILGLISLLTLSACGSSSPTKSAGAVSPGSTVSSGSTVSPASTASSAPASSASASTSAPATTSAPAATSAAAAGSSLMGSICTALSETLTQIRADEKTTGQSYAPEAVQAQFALKSLGNADTADQMSAVRNGADAAAESHCPADRLEILKRAQKSSLAILLG